MLLYSEGCLEIHFGIVVAALEQLFHLFDGGLAGIGARAGVCDGVDRDIVELGQEHVFRHKALFGGVAVRAVVGNAMGDVQIVVHPAQRRNEQGDLRRRAA